MIIEIDDADDPRISGYRQVRERDLVGREGKFIAEGEVVLRVLARSTSCRAASVLVDRRRLAGLAEILGGFGDQVPVYVAGQAVIDTVAGFHLHRGILALGERHDPPRMAELLRTARLVVGVFGVGNHDNIGGIFRNAAGFGADAVLLDGQCCDPLYRKAIRVSVGAALIMPFARFEVGSDPLQVLEAAGFSPFALSPSGERRLAEITPPDRSALLFGAEGPGLPDDLLSRAQSVRIDMAAGFDSLNVATASGIVLHHFSRSGSGR